MKLEEKKKRDQEEKDRIELIRKNKELEDKRKREE